MCNPRPESALTNIIPTAASGRIFNSVLQIDGFSVPVSLGETDLIPKFVFSCRPCLFYARKVGEHDVIRKSIAKLQSFRFCAAKVDWMDH